MDKDDKKDRMLNIFFRAFRGEDISVSQLANEFSVSTKSVSRDIGEIKNFLSENRELVGNTEFEYFYQDKVYRLKMDDFLLSKELIALVKILIGSRALSKIELLTMLDKIRHFAVPTDRKKINSLVEREIYHYHEVKHDCECVEDTLFQLTKLIDNKNEITVHYYKMNRDFVDRRICPVSLMFTDYYFYLIAFRAEDKEKMPIYFRVDRIKNITEHREKFSITKREQYDEGVLRERCQFMFPGKLQTIRFEFSGPSIQAILDRLPTARVIDKRGEKYIVEAKTYGDGIKMYLLSQGANVKVIFPKDFVEEMKEEINKLNIAYNS